MQAHFSISLLFSVHSVLFLLQSLQFSSDALLGRTGKVRRGLNAIQFRIALGG
ncbi:hypothetical protein L873DRAFT_1809197 [Choiromyces venosus 120613-1]|uniref:Uncharacterized protein n=1 Tax=Choiromyces venosus 120613-1 TaxID=1336337 RepID=A0A3N4JHM5_9PEZI|nr:hypothetical protein L873DRAFT_1809197 [Choiromyces venosus 120613-1]